MVTFERVPKIKLPVLKLKSAEEIARQELISEQAIDAHRRADESKTEKVKSIRNNL